MTPMPTRAQTDPGSSEATQVAQIKDLQRRRSERRRRKTTAPATSVGGQEEEELDGCRLEVPRHKLSRDGVHFVSPYPSPTAEKQTFVSAHRAAEPSWDADNLACEDDKNQSLEKDKVETVTTASIDQLKENEGKVETN